MNRLASVIGVGLCCILLCTCGTGRAIVGDYKADYEIRNIRPLSVVSGQDVTFEADVIHNAGGNDPADYTWNFGGGADPNVSFEESPVVTIRDGIRAPYDCTLTVRSGNEKADEVTATFTLNVEPLNVIAVTPTTGEGGAGALFTAVIGSGNVTSYAWDFGGACSPNGSNLIHPNVTFTQNPGTYDGRVLISNSYEVFEFPFTITVVAGPPPDSGA